MKPLIALLLASAAVSASGNVDVAYRAEVERWRQEREERIKAEDGWLAVAGLFWLSEGANTFGAAPDSAIVLPAGSAPAAAGAFELAGRRVTLRLQPGVDAAVGGRAVAGPLVLRPDTAGEPDVVELGRLRMFVIERDDRLGVRLRDPESAVRNAFQGLRWFPVKEEYRVTARFVPTGSRTILLPNVLGQVSPMVSPGYASFVLAGREHRLDPVLEGDDQLMFVFRDETAGSETYPAGRFVYSALPKDGQVVLDFNKAYSPPCAYTRYATCPLPPKQNRLPVRIEAGEKDPKLLH